MSSPDQPNRKTLSGKKKLLFGGVVCLVFFLGFIGLDLIVRVVDPPPDESQSPFGEVAYRVDKDYLIDLKPNIEKGFGSTTWKTNSLGLRGPEPETGDQVKRVLVIGDSNIQARFSGLSETFCHQLEEDLEALRADTQFTVLNGGVIGFGPDQSYLRLRQRIDELKPDFLVFHVFADNDLGDLLRNRLFDVADDQTLTRRGLIVDEEWTDRSSVPLIQRWWATSIYKRLQYKLKGYSSSNVAETENMDDVIADGLAESEAEYAGYTKGEPSLDPFSDGYDYDLSLAPDSDSAMQKLQLLRGVLLATAELCKDRSIPVYALIQPASRDLTDSLRPNHQDFATYSDTYTRRGFSGRVEAVAKDCGIPTLNLFDPFDSHETTNDLYFKIADNHWNALGQEVAAQAMAKFLSENWDQQ